MDNLPSPATRLIGRKEQGPSCVRRLLSGDVRLLTPTGPPGIGKTRLALAAAADLAGALPHWACFVDLSAICGEGLVVHTIGQVLGIRERPGQSVREQVGRALQGRQMLLVLVMKTTAP